MDAMSDPAVERVSVQKSARIGYTKMIGNLLGYHIHQDPCSVLIVQPTIDDAMGYSKDELQPFFRDCEVLNQLVAEDKTRSAANTLLRKVYPGGTLYLVGANSARGFRRISVRIVCFDEVDGYPPSAGSEGDQILLGVRRTEYFHNRKIILGSTPTLAHASRIADSYAESDQRRYWVPCPHCGEYQVLVWGDGTGGGIVWPKDKPHKASYECAQCAKSIDHKNKREMVRLGRWQAGEAFEGHAGFHIWAGYSFSPNAAWGVLAAEWMAAQRDDEKLQTFINTALGEVWEPRGVQVEEGALIARRRPYRAPVQNGSVLTAGIDVQGDRVECEIASWGEGEEVWSVDYFRLYGDLAAGSVWDALLGRLTRNYDHANGEQLNLALVCIDSGFYTDEVYAFSRAAGPRFVIPTKGSSLPAKPIASFPINPNRKRVFLTTVGHDTCKQVIMNRLVIPEPGPGYCHWPDAPIYDEEYFKQLTSEKLVSVTRHGVQKTYWQQTRARNEALDCRVLNLAAIRILQQHGGVVLKTYDEDLYGGEVPPPVGGALGTRAPAAAHRSKFFDSRAGR